MADRPEDPAEQRARQESMRAEAGQSTTLAGLLIDLGERGAQVSVQLANGASHLGTVGDVGLDYFRLDAPTGPVLIHLPAVTTVRPPQNTPAGFSARTGTDATLNEVLADLAAERTEVAITMINDAAPLHGQVMAASADVVAVHLPGGQQVFVTHRHIADVRLTERSAAW